jgi:recombination protein RecT
VTQILKKDAEHPAITLVKTALPTLQAVLPSHASPAKQVALVKHVFRTNSRLKNCTPLSLVNAVIGASELGLDIGRTAHLVPFGKECVLIPDYRGLMDLARRDGTVKGIMARVVHEKDVFHYEYGLEPKLQHTPADGNRGPAKYYYAIARMKDADPEFDVMSLGDVNKVRDKTQSWKKSKADSPWTTSPDPMGCKTVVKRLCKFLPQTPDLSKALAADDQGEMQGRQVFDITEGLEAVAEQEGETKPKTLDDVVEQPPAAKKKAAPKDTPPAEPPKDKNAAPSSPTEIAALKDSIKDAYAKLSMDNKAIVLKNWQMATFDLSDIDKVSDLMDMMFEIKGMYPPAP